MKKTLYILTCINCSDSYIASMDAYPTKEEAQAAMKESYDIEFREELPKTLVGKVAYRVLQEEELNYLIHMQTQKLLQNMLLPAVPIWILL